MISWAERRSGVSTIPIRSRYREHRSSDRHNNQLNNVRRARCVSRTRVRANSGLTSLKVSRYPLNAHIREDQPIFLRAERDGPMVRQPHALSIHVQHNKINNARRQMDQLRTRSNTRRASALKVRSLFTLFRHAQFMHIVILMTTPYHL